MKVLRYGALLMLLAALPAGALHAHETLFGPVPRTIWKGGMELEAEYEFELYRRFWSHDRPASNPRNLIAHVHTFSVAFTYGVTRDVAVQAMLPVGYATRKSKDFEDSYFGLKDSMLAVKYRFYNRPFPGGSWQSGVYGRLHLPTAARRDDMMLTGDRISFGDETWGFEGGFNFSWSTRQQYVWFDVATDFHTRRSGDGHGPGIQLHPSYAWRVFELMDYRDFDLILLFEGDLAARAPGWQDGEQMHDSGYYTVHLGFGVQFNITNRLEFKLGYNLPVYRIYNGTQFVHEGEAVFMFNYLF
jgi:hypothetical protein